MEKNGKKKLRWQYVNMKIILLADDTRALFHLITRICRRESNADSCNCVLKIVLCAFFSHMHPNLRVFRIEFFRLFTHQKTLRWLAIILQNSQPVSLYFLLRFLNRVFISDNSVNGLLPPNGAFCMVSANDNDKVNLLYNTKHVHCVLCAK